MMEKQLSLQENLKSFEKKQIVVGLLVLLILIGLSIIANRLFMQAAAEQTSRLITRMIQIDDFREINLTLQDAKLDYFSKIKYESKSLNHSFTFPPLAEYVHETSIWESLTREHIEVIPHSIGTRSGEDKIIFDYNRFGFVGYAFGIWLLLILVSVPQTRFIKNRIIKQFEKDLEFQKKSAHTEVSRKVRHNINTPLSALIGMTERLEKLGKEDQDLFQSIVKQIRSLVQDLDIAEKQVVPPGISVITEVGQQSEANNIFVTLQESFSENKLAFKNRNKMETKTDSTLMSAKVEFTPHELRSIIGNLAQNAVDASLPESLIKISARDLSNRVEIAIQDFGKGIPEKLISKVTEKNVSIGKTNGTGLGLYHAKSWIESWGGNLHIASIEGRGTCVTITLSIQERAKWFSPRIKVRANQQLIILDDQDLQHQQWKIRLKENNFSGQAHYFYNAKDFEDYKKDNVNDHNASEFIFLFDNNLGDHNLLGIDLLRGLPASATKYLITGDAQEPWLQRSCEEDKIFLIAKSDFADTPFVNICS